MRARVDVIIPTARRASLLARAIASVRAQTFEALRIIVALDGHDAPTEEVLRKASAEEPRLTVVPVQLGGSPARARNAGLAAVTAPLVAFLDDDDEWLPQKLARQVPVFDTPEIVLCCARIEEFGARSGTWPTAPVPSFVSKERLWAGNEIATSSAVARTETLRRAGAFDERWTLAEDYDLWLRLADLGDIFFVDEVLSRYRIHEANLSQREDRVLAQVEQILRRHAVDGHLPRPILHRRLQQTYTRRAELADRLAARLRLRLRRALIPWLD